MNRLNQEPLVLNITLNKKALSLLEIIISTVILALVMAGMANIFVIGKQHVLHTRERIASAELGKLFIDPLQVYVRQDTWATNPLGAPSGDIQDSKTVNNQIFNFTSTISTDALGNPELRRITTKIEWIEPAP